MKTLTSDPAPAISFPRATFAKLSPHPYLLAHLQPPSQEPARRANGRLPTQFRAPHVNSSSITHAEGSAVVRLGDTTVVCGVRAEILLGSNVPDHRVSRTSRANMKSGWNGLSYGEASSEAQDLDLLVPNIELATGCSPAFLPGQPPSALAQSLSTRVYSLLHSSRLIDGEDLRIWYQPLKMSGLDEDAMEDEDGNVGAAEVKAFWTLYIDVLFISLDGNPFDAAWAAILVALRDVRLPFAYWDPDQELILCSDEMASSKRLNLPTLPVASTFMVFREKDRAQVRGGKLAKTKYWVLADPDTFEEGLCDESVTVTVDRSGGRSRILGISKAGGVMLGKSEMRSVVEMAETRWEEWRVVLESAKKT